MILAQDPSPPGEGVFVEAAGLLVLPEVGQVVGETVGRAERVGVAFASDPPTTGEGVLVEEAGMLVLPEPG